MPCGWTRVLHVCGPFRRNDDEFSFLPTVKFIDKRMLLVSWSPTYPSFVPIQINNNHLENIFTFSYVPRKDSNFFFVLQDLKDYMRQAGEVTYADAHKQHRNEG